MTLIEKTTIEEIEAKLKSLKSLRNTIETLDKVTKLIEPADELEFQKLRAIGQVCEDGIYISAAYTPEAHLVALLISKIYWQRQIPPLEKWLDDRNIQHTEPEKE